MFVVDSPYVFQMGPFLAKKQGGIVLLGYAPLFFLEPDYGPDPALKPPKNKFTKYEYSSTEVPMPSRAQCGAQYVLRSGRLAKNSAAHLGVIVSLCGS